MVQEGARGWARTWSAHCRAFAAFARASKRTRVPGVSSFMTQPRTSSHRIFAGAAPRGRFRRPLSARDCFCFARRAAQYPASLTPGISAAAFNAGLQNMRGGSSERKNAAKGRFTFCILIDHRGPPGAILRNSARGPYKAMKPKKESSLPACLISVGPQSTTKSADLAEKEKLKNKTKLG